MLNEAQQSNFFVPRRRAPPPAALFVLSRFAYLSNPIILFFVGWLVAIAVVDGELKRRNKSKKEEEADENHENGP